MIKVSSKSGRLEFGGLLYDESIHTKVEDFMIKVSSKSGRLEHSKLGWLFYDENIHPKVED